MGWINRLRAKLATWWKRSAVNRVVQDSAWMLSGQGLRAVIQFAYFVLLARTLGAEGYGAFAGVTALVAVLVPFSGLGSETILIQDVSRDQSVFARRWAAVLLVVSGTGLGLVGLTYLASSLFLPQAIPTVLIVTVSVSELILFRLVNASARAFQAFEHFSRTALLNVVWATAKLLAAGLLLTIPAWESLGHWGLIYCSAACLAALISVTLVTFELGVPEVWPIHFKDLFGRRGMLYSINEAARTVYDDIDKTMLTRLSTLSSAGLYKAGYRIVDVAFMPIRALLRALFPKFFRWGDNGLAAVVTHSGPYLMIAIVYSVAAGLVLYLCAPLLPYLLGGDYGNSVTVVRWLCIVPVIKAFQYFAADPLTGADKHEIRTYLQLAAAGINVGANLILIPTYSWRGAVAATIGTEVLLTIALWSVIGLSLRQEWS